MENKDLRPVVEAILYASGAPVELARLEGTLDAPRKVLLEVLDEIKEEYADDRHGFELVRTGDNFRFVTKLALGQTVSTYLATRKTNLSNAAMDSSHYHKHISSHKYLLEYFLYHKMCVC